METGRAYGWCWVKGVEVNQPLLRPWAPSCFHSSEIKSGLYSLPSY